jgi:CheY-like chemotaxis protein
MISVLLADDHSLIREGFRLILDAEPDIDVAGEAADGTTAVSMTSALRPGVVLMDLRMPGRDGIQATRDIADALLPSKVLMLTTFDLDDYVYAVASGFLLKTPSPTTWPRPSAPSRPVMPFSYPAPPNASSASATAAGVPARPRGGTRGSLPRRLRLGHWKSGSRRFAWLPPPVGKGAPANASGHQVAAQDVVDSGRESEQRIRVSDQGQCVAVGQGSGGGALAGRPAAQALVRESWRCVGHVIGAGVGAGRSDLVDLIDDLVVQGDVGAGEQVV